MNKNSINNISNQKFTFFFHQSSPFSQWYICEFEENGIIFNCMEQYMMFHKAILFGNYDVALRIKNIKYNPREYKRIGRKEIKNFNSKIWDINKRLIVTKGNILKFSQNPKLKIELLSTKDTTLVEASPYDKIWGCGLSQEDSRIHNPRNWTGQNLLGDILTEIRDGFIREMK